MLESDCLKLVSHLKKGSSDQTSFGNIVNDILELGKSCGRISCKHVGRDVKR